MIGKLRKRLVIESPTRTADGQGGAAVSWSTFATRWGSVEPVSASQAWHAERLQHRVSHKIVLREVSGLRSDMRISYDSRIFQIQSFRDMEERGRFHEIMAQEGAAS